MATVKITRVFPANVKEGEKVTFEVEFQPRALATPDGFRQSYRIDIYNKDQFTGSVERTDEHTTCDWDTRGNVAGEYSAWVSYPSPTTNDASTHPDLPPDAAFRIEGAQQHITTDVTMQRPGSYPSDDQALWVAIRNRTNAISFDKYKRFIDLVLCEEASEFWKKISAVNKALFDSIGVTNTPHLNIYGSQSYSILKAATQIFLMLECGVVIEESRWGGGYKLLDLDDERYRLSDPTVTFESLKNRLTSYLSGDNHQALPYLNRIVGALMAVNPDKEMLPYCDGILKHRYTHPSLQELIWSYWHEEGMLVQTMNTIAMRFQNQRSSHYDPLGELEIDPLRPLNNIIWGYVQDEHNRLSVRRRDSEYGHHYGLRLLGRAVSPHPVADNRSKFIEAFHSLLYRAAVFFRDDSDTTVIADAFPLLNALKNVHLILAEGAHNQFGDMPTQSRAEMLTMQWILARPEMREFLRGRHMVPYQEAWMGAVDAMKKLQGWTDNTITHFHELAVHGERLLLSIRYGDWSDLNNTENQAKNWARYWKSEIQRYLLGYQSVTGVDLMADTTNSQATAERYLMPSLLLQRKLSAQSRPRALPNTRTAVALEGMASGYAEMPLARPRARALRYKQED